ncbi:hypothetical protein [Geodermatophilus sp. URMC 62]|uniref:hypothetical protein n=1 Tax=Geodermatophilus sp. URMC 62 TaxID=3423414 RepID=UPI00406CA851
MTSGNGEAPGVGNAEGQDAGSTTTPPNVTRQVTNTTYSSSRRLLAGLIGYVTGGRDRPAEARFTTAATPAAELVNRGADRTTVAALVLAAESVSIPGCRAEDVLRSALRGAR